MSKSRFKAINTCLRLDTFVPTSVNKDPCQSIQSFVDGFNWRMKTVVKFIIIVDELVSFGKGWRVTSVTSRSYLEEEEVQYFRTRPADVGDVRTGPL